LRVRGFGPIMDVNGLRVGPTPGFRGRPGPVFAGGAGPACDTGDVSQRVRTAVRVEGIVQGVGFRPFVYSLATSLGLAGLVGNDVDGVFAEVEGSPAAVETFLASLARDAPPLARIERITTSAMRPDGGSSFTIAPSEPGSQRRTLISADTATCAACLAEMAEPGDRRHGYAFINCTHCGPRFTIVRDVPYDRPATTMAGFTMCEACAAEYHDPADRRFHAQPTCCPACGPRLVLLDAAGKMLAGDPLAAAAGLLRGGRVLGVKGLGGYHLAVDAASETAAAALRARKHREDKPFAVMAADLAAARRLCEVDETAARLLTSTRRPIVLLPRLPAADVAPAVAPGNRQLGVMLPYTPLHHLLLREVGRPMVLTSGNVSDEPIVYADDEAAERLSPIADALLTHDRPIETRTDDSVTRSFRGREMVIRRSRGYVPEPLEVAARFPRPVLACGAELKNTFCLARESHAFVSHHIGDLENAETLRSFTEGIRHFRRLFGITPQVVAHDLHPEYLSTKYATDLAERGIDGGPGPGEVELVGVQHHHAHIASCLADNRVGGPVIGVAFDGTGYGTDGTIWGGEFLIADTARFERAGHLATIPMPGGAAAIRQPWRMAAAYLGAQSSLDVARRNERFWPAIVAMAQRGINSPLTSSAGRLFDAVAAILGVRDAINYEGQAAVELEQLADPAERGAYHATITVADAAPGVGPPVGLGAGAGSGPALRIAGIDLVRAVAEDLAAGTDRSLIAARFHNGVAGLIRDCCLLLRERHGLAAVALSGGVFQNLLLLHATVARLEDHGFEVLVHSRVPCNDGGISLGQAIVASSSP
jgi:hydrogenase maturation protein HypF